MVPLSAGSTGARWACAGANKVRRASSAALSTASTTCRAGMSSIICHTAAASTLRLQGKGARQVVLQSPDALSTLPGRFTDSAVCLKPQDPYEMKTAFAQPASVRADWYVIDAKGKTLGRLASRIALRLKGKHKADYSPHVDMGDHIVVLNAEHIAVTGNKLDD